MAVALDQMFLSIGMCGGLLVRIDESIFWLVNRTRNTIGYALISGEVGDLLRNKVERTNIILSYFTPR